MKIATRSSISKTSTRALVGILAIDICMTLQFGNSVEWQESDTLSQHSRGSYTRDIDLRTSRPGRGPAKRE